MIKVFLLLKDSVELVHRPLQGSENPGLRTPAAGLMRGITIVRAELHLDLLSFLSFDTISGNEHFKLRYL